MYNCPYFIAVMANSSPSISFSSSSTNYARIGHAAQQLFPDILQELITLKEPPNKLSHDVNTCTDKYLKTNLRPGEISLINGVIQKGYADFDIALIYKLVRHLKLIPPPTQGWASSCDPCPTDITPGDDLERIRKLRNEILHRGNAHVTDTEISQFFTQFKDIARRLESYLGKKPGEFVDKFINLEKCCIDEKMKNVYDDLKNSYEDYKKSM